MMKNPRPYPLGQDIGTITHAWAGLMPVRAGAGTAEDAVGNEMPQRGRNPGVMASPASMTTTFSISSKQDNDVKWGLCMRQNLNQAAVGDLFGVSQPALSGFIVLSFQFSNTNCLGRNPAQARSGEQIPPFPSDPAAPSRCHSKRYGRSAD
ncbi:hypothetical protein ACIRU3_08935 [Streptomyces sp. NPDC101151]|uniref:hypothetical protein n=1 Tax=Streptomyces sp. NPDC101151 TaxID=3366115 RepID=UPI00381420A3